MKTAELRDITDAWQREEISYSKMVDLINEHQDKKLQQLIKYLESKVNLKFDFDVEYWESGNFDDAYYYGREVGEEYSFREILEKAKQIINNEYK